MATADSTEVSHVIQLLWEANDGIVTVTPQDNDRFAVKVGKAIQVLQQADHQDRFEKQLQVLMKELAEWIQGQDEVDAAYLTLRDGCLAFVVVKKTPAYDEGFEDAISDLDIRIAQDVDLDLIRLNTITLPSVSLSALQSFLDPNFVLRYHQLTDN